LRGEWLHGPRLRFETVVTVVCVSTVELGDDLRRF
jgi:hypothetical protein